jgi:hypothetical protein
MVFLSSVVTWKFIVKHSPLSPHKSILTKLDSKGINPSTPDPPLRWDLANVWKQQPTMHVLSSLITNPHYSCLDQDMW